MKKIISLALVLCTMLLLSLSAAAIDIDKLVNDQLASITASEREGVIEVLNFVEGMKETFQLENVDFDELEIGNKIRTYEATETGLSEVGYVYPIIYGDAVVAIATPINCGKFQISIKDAKAIQESGFRNIAIIYGKEGEYIFNGSDIRLIISSIFPTESRISLSELTSENIAVSTESDIVFTDITVKTNLEYQRQNSVSSATSSAYKYLNVAHVDSVPNTNTCWAGAIAMIINYKNKSSFTAHDIALAIQGPDYPTKKGENLNDSVDKMNKNYGLEYTASGSNSLSSECPSDSVILRNLNGDYPVLGRLRVTDIEDESHAVVIYGIDILSGYISVDDPSFGVFTSYRCYHAIHESNSYYGKYVYSTDKYFMYLDGFAGAWISDVN